MNVEFPIKETVSEERSHRSQSAIGLSIIQAIRIAMQAI